MAWRFSSGLKNALMNDKGLKEVFANGQIRIFSGPQPSSADDGETGTLLCVVTLGSSPMTSGTATNGLNFDTPVNGVISKPIDAIWSGKNIATGSAGWFRWYPNAFDLNSGQDTAGIKIRMDGNCGTSNAQCILPSTSLQLNITTTIDNVSLTF